MVEQQARASWPTHLRCAALRPARRPLGLGHFVLIKMPDGARVASVAASCWRLASPRPGVLAHVRTPLLVGRCRAHTPTPANWQERNRRTGLQVRRLGEQLRRAPSGWRPGGGGRGPRKPEPRREDDKKWSRRLSYGLMEMPEGGIMFEAAARLVRPVAPAPAPLECAPKLDASHF